MRYEEMVEMYKNDPVSFVINHGTLQGVTKENQGFLFEGRFEFTEDLLCLFEKSDKTIVVKKRQQGISQDLIAFAAWHLLMKPISHVMLMTFKHDVADSMYNRMKFFLDGLSNGLEYDIDYPAENGEFLDTKQPFVLFNESVFTVVSGITPNIDLYRSSVDILLIDEVQVFFQNYAHLARLLFMNAKKSVMVGTMFNAEDCEHELTWFDTYVNSMQFLDDVRVVRL